MIIYLYDSNPFWKDGLETDSLLSILEQLTEDCYTRTWWHHAMEMLSNYWPFPLKIPWSLVNSPHQGPVMQSFALCVVSFDKLLNKQ